ncbi:hypothetical protein [Schaalia sp. lx-260]|uniref:hypothetical protein n=1 Tax=Schaalia sp. lx-260 TaxID=2899082 RepID=UPI001E6286D8|nr:hypothetical protein [Schaalia sp. lx-260]MCD4549406.1 hypothetical protein [Schaalia sp. lx-260]
MLLKRTFISVLLCGFLALSIAGCADISTQGLSGSSESTNESSESDSPHMVVVESRDEQPESSRRWFALSREEQRKIDDEEMRQNMSCLEEKGWKVEQTNNYGQLSYSIDTQGDDALFAQMIRDSEECEKLSPSPYRDLVISVPDIEDIYEYRLTVKACLENEGIKITDPPTKQKFIDDFRNDRSYWNPYTDLMDVSNLTASRFREITEKCPQY